MGLHDAYRLFEQPEKTYSWWDYREFAFRRNRGLRIDHILVTEPLREKVGGAGVDRGDFTGRRIPSLPARPDLAKVKFGDPVALFNGRDLAGWRARRCLTLWLSRATHPCRSTWRGG